MSSYGSYGSASHDAHLYPQTPHGQPQSNPTTAMIPHPNSSYTSQQLQPVAQPQQQEPYYYPEHPGNHRQSSHYSHHSHHSRHSHHPHDSNTTTDSDEERRYKEDKELERRPTLGGSLLSLFNKLSRFLGSERR